MKDYFAMALFVTMVLAMILAIIVVIPKPVLLIIIGLGIWLIGLSFAIRWVDRKWGL